MVIGTLTVVCICDEPVSELSVTTKMYVPFGVPKSVIAAVPLHPEEN
jgi:hypothetical protein